MIVPMKRLTLVALREDEERIMKGLQAISAVQVLESTDAPSGKASLANAENEVQKLGNAFSLIKPYAKKPSMLAEKPETTLEELHSIRQEALNVGQRIEEADYKKTALNTQIDKNNTLIALLTPWRELQTKLEDVQGTKSASLFCGMLKNEETPKLSGLPDYVAVQCFAGEKETAVLALSPIEEQETVEAFLKELGFADINLPKLPLTAGEAIINAQKEIASMQEELQELDKVLYALGENRALIAGASDLAGIERDRAVAENGLLETADAFMLEGWVREDQQTLVKDTLINITDACFIEFSDPTEEEIPPTAVKNSKSVKPYEAVTNLYSQPHPKSIDGTPFMMPFYFLFFGMMLSDSGYGLILTLGCLFFLKKAKPRGMMGSLARVIMWGGVSTMIWGFLVGTFFGMDWNMLFYGVAEGPFPLIVNPNTDPITMLILCFGLGIIHIFYGVGIKIYMCLREGDWQSALFDNFSWMLIVFGLILFAVLPAIKTVGLGMAVLGAAMVLFMKGRGKPKVISRAVSGLAGLYDITSYLSDILSYARLFALGIATGVIGSVFNSLAGMIMTALPGVIGQIIGIAIGVALLCALHAFNIAINTLGTFIHCARLQYVEFYGKFYEVGGKEFRPLGYKTKHTYVPSKG